MKLYLFSFFKLKKKKQYDLELLTLILFSFNSLFSFTLFCIKQHVGSPLDYIPCKEKKEK